MCFCTICRNSCARQADSEMTLKMLNFCARQADSEMALKMLNFHETMSWVFGFVGLVLVL